VCAGRCARVCVCHALCMSLLQGHAALLVLRQETSRDC
jgi:hypothetical protein